MLIINCEKMQTSVINFKDSNFLLLQLVHTGLFLT